MKKRSYILKISAWFIIGLWLTRSYLFRLIHVDFATIDFARNFRHIWLVFIPLAIGLLIVSTWKDLKLNYKRILILVLSTSLSIGLIIVLNFFAGFCEWQFSEPLYKHRTLNKEIRFHILDCGATDGNPTNDIVTTHNIGPFFIKYSKISREEISEKEWIKQ
jgi:hypothetical protein